MEACQANVKIPSTEFGNVKNLLVSNEGRLELVNSGEHQECDYRIRGQDCPTRVEGQQMLDYGERQIHAIESYTSC